MASRHETGGAPPDYLATNNWRSSDQSPTSLVSLLPYDAQTGMYGGEWEQYGAKLDNYYDITGVRERIANDAAAVVLNRTVSVDEVFEAIVAGNLDPVY